MSIVIEFEHPAMDTFRRAMLVGDEGKLEVASVVAVAYDGSPEVRRLFIQISRAVVDFMDAAIEAEGG
jgi:hypothetical protein